jgi:hypothetical protein
VVQVRYCLLLFLLFGAFPGFSQTVFTKRIAVTYDTIQVDTVSIYRAGFEVQMGNIVLPVTFYNLDAINARLVFKTTIDADSVTIRYERMPLNFSQHFSHKSEQLIVPDSIQDFDPYIYSVSANNPQDDLFGSSKLNKQGSISRGVTVGNAQNLSLQSTLNLQLDGQIGPNLYMKGSISDDNIPFQPEGNTQQLQEFDQVYMKVYNEDFAVIGGDFWLYKPTGYFLNYTKRTQGVSIEAYHPFDIGETNAQASHKISGAFSKGKFSRNIVQGIEGNQGPYRLRGAENESFIVVLAGTEKVYIDGKLLTRGQEFDYTIDYNTAEVTFTANQLITKDKRIVVEFQYSDLNYARSLFAYNVELKSERFHTWVNVFSEQDAKNQTIQQNLTDEKKTILAGVGDSLADAYSNSIDSVGFYDSRVLYAMIDSLGFDSVLVFSINPDSAYYQATFLNVGPGNGDYVFEKFTANGKVYKWVMPVGGVSQGDYAPIQLLKPPQKKQMYVIGTEVKLFPGIITSAEIAMSGYDKNTFSPLHSADDEGLAVKWKWKSDHALNENLRLQSNANFELQGNNFQPIQWFRSVEFDRDWNIRGLPYSGNQYLSNVGLKLLGKNTSFIGYDFENFTWGTDYTGFRNNLAVNVKKDGFNYKADASYLLSGGVEETSFMRHTMAVSQNMKFIKVGAEDIHEWNEKRPGEFLALTSYRFYDWKAYIATPDSFQNQFSVYYRERYDWFSDSTTLRQATRAQNVGLNADLNKNANATLRLNLNYRILDIIDTTLFGGTPENTLLNRVEHTLRLWRGAVLATTFYEVGSGLELKKEFIYIEVNPGQGTYTWIDYNGDGVKDLGEFEIAVFTDQGNYIRVFIPTNTYIRTYSNQFSTSLILSPEKVWNSSKGIKKFVSRFSNQVIYKLNRKTSYADNLEALNPFVYNIADTSLVSMSGSFRNTLYFNKTNSVFGVTYSYQENGSKILLSNGFDSRLHTFHDARFRWNISKYYNLRVNGLLGRKRSSSDYTTGRDYFIEYVEIEPTFSYQPGTAFRISLSGKYTEKENQSDLAEKAIIRNIGVDLRVNQAQKGSFSLQLNYIVIDYNASANTSLAFEMLEGLKTGNNVTWGLSYQRKIATNLQLNFTYNGRKSELNSAIHSGGMELRAFF